MAIISSAPPGTTSPKSSERRPRRFLGRRWWAWVVLVVWVGLAGVLAGQSANLEEVVESGATAYLPQTSASKQVVDTTEAFGDETALPATVIWTRPDGLTDADRRQITERVDEIRSTFGDDLTSTGVIGPMVSDDGAAMQVVLPLAGSDSNVISEKVTELRQVLAPQDGLQGAVTGPAGINADMRDALGAIDVMLVAVTCGLILVILLAVYRSALLPLLVIGVGVLALGSALGALYLLAHASIIRIGAEVQGIISVLVLGCATDYALLMVDRFSRELKNGADRDTAIRRAWRACVEPVVASAATVILGLMCLLLSDLGLNRQLGPAAATGIFFAMVAMLTLMPAVLRLFGPAAFWPRKLVAAPVPEDPARGGGRARRSRRQARGYTSLVVPLLAKRPRVVWVSLTLLLALAATAVGGLKAGGLTDNDMVMGASVIDRVLHGEEAEAKAAADPDTAVESRVGQARSSTHFGADVGSPAIILVDADRLTQARDTAEDSPGIDRVQVWTGQHADPAAAAAAPPVEVDGRVRLDAFLDDAADSPKALETVTTLRERLERVGGDPLVGGQTAVRLDFNDAAVDDRQVLALLLAVVFVVVCLLLRSLVAPLIVVVSVVLSYLAAMGVSTLIFQDLLGFPGSDASFPIHAFVFLVALGVDYSIFLMARVREKVSHLGPRTGLIAGLQETNGVITSAGLVLAATFAALGLVPLVLMVQLAFIVAFGVLLDTFIVRSLLVPALALDLGPAMWFPNRKLASVPEADVAATPPPLTTKPVGSP